MLYYIFSPLLKSLWLESAKSAHQQYYHYLMLLVMVYGDDDHCHVNYKKTDEAEMPCAGKLTYLIVMRSGGYCTKQILFVII